MLFERPLPSFTKNIIYIDRPSNHKTRLEIICSIFFWKQLPSTRHTTIWRLCRFHLSYRGKYDKKSCLKYSIHCCFPAFFFFANRRRRIPAVSRINLKFTEDAQTKCPSTHGRYMYDFIAILEFYRSGRLERERNWYQGGEQWSKRKENWGGGAIDIPSPPPFTSDFKSNMACTCPINDRELLNVNSP